MRVCPKCNGDRFLTTGIELHDWVVDGNGEFIEDDGCFDSKLGGGCWECTNCGAVYESNKELKEV